MYSKRSDEGVLLGLRGTDAQPSALMEALTATLSAAFPADLPQDVRFAVTKYTAPPHTPNSTPAQHPDRVYMLQAWPTLSSPVQEFVPRRSSPDDHHPAQLLAWQIAGFVGQEWCLTYLPEQKMYVMRICPRIYAVWVGL